MTTDETPSSPGPISPSGPRINLGPHLVIGLVVTAVGVALLLDTLNIYDARELLRFWPVALILYGASLIVQAFWPELAGDAGGRRRRSIGPAFLFVLIMFAMVVPRIDRPRSATRTDTDSTVSLVTLMGRDRQLSLSQEFQGGDITSVMGGTELDLTQAKIAPGREAVIDVFGAMGGVVIRVPPGWVVDMRAVAVMGGINDRRSDRPSAADREAPRLVVRGTIMMGGLVIR